MEAKKVKGSDGFGNDREYEFRVLTALEGLTLIHEYGGRLAAFLPQISDVFAALNEKSLVELAKEDMLVGAGPVFELAKFIPAIVPTDRMVQIVKIFLAGSKINGQECDEDGMCDLFKGRPHEIYAAVIQAVMVNFPDYLPFLGTPDDTTGMKSGSKAKK